MRQYLTGGLATCAVLPTVGLDQEDRREAREQDGLEGAEEERKQLQRNGISKMQLKRKKFDTRSFFPNNRWRSKTGTHEEHANGVKENRLHPPVRKLDGKPAEKKTKNNPPYSRPMVASFCAGG